jgi:predicted HD superfamily hydrolase involved in NAD metabolism
MSSIQSWVETQLDVLPQTIREHVLRVRGIALALAERHGVDSGRTWLAISSHDLARGLTDAQLLAEASRLGISIGPEERATPILLHGPVAAGWLKREGLTDAGVYDAVFWHSTARPDMPPLEQVVFLADKLDPRKARRYRGLADMRVLAERDLPAALLTFLELDMSRLLRDGKVVHPATLAARNKLLIERLDRRGEVGTLPAR